MLCSYVGVDEGTMGGSANELEEVTTPAYRCLDRTSVCSLICSPKALDTLSLAKCVAGRTLALDAKKKVTQLE